MESVTPDTPLGRVAGGKTANAFEKAFGYVLVGDVLGHYPRRYSERGELTSIRHLPLGEHVTIIAKVVHSKRRQMKNRRGSLLEVLITDGAGELSLTFFSQPWREKELQPGTRGIFAGKVSQFNNKIQLAHPDYELISEHNPGPPPEREQPGDAASVPRLFGDSSGVHRGGHPITESEIAARAWAERPIPIYPATATLNSWTIQKTIATILSVVDTPDPLPLALRKAETVLPLQQSLRMIHQPANEGEWQEARASLRFREALHLQLALLRERQRNTQQVTKPRTAAPSGILHRFDERLPYPLTGDQILVGREVTEELSEPVPMHRLLQGEVGSGKTLVALRAMLQVAESGGQSALLVPTEVLAAQHFRSIVDTLGPELEEEISPVLITGQLPAKTRREAHNRAAEGAAKIVIGTHALLSDSTQFQDLGLIVVDEQHRFGVEQRETLRRKAEEFPPHVLVMTATPIPRTVALTAFGDLEVSVIRELPPGRLGIKTFAVATQEHPHWERRAWERAAEEIALGRQVYVVCPAIAPGATEHTNADPAGPPTPSEVSPGAGGKSVPRPLANVEETLQELAKEPSLIGARIAALTGAMSVQEKDSVMADFAAGNIDVLVATTVIEVGVNVPNAALMVVRDADRFGVSQLHQLRGRVGRGSVPGLCLLVTGAPAGSLARTRVDQVAATTDGFKLAEVDLQLRREGDILGSAQSGGNSTLRLLRVLEDGDLIASAREIGAALLSQDPNLDRYPELREVLDRERAHVPVENLAKS